jgi:hypothetical protein
MAEAVYAIEDFPADELLWRIEWIGGVGYNANVPSDPLIDVCLAQLPVGETNQLSARSRSSQTKRTVRIGIGLLPYISIASVWRGIGPVGLVGQFWGLDSDPNPEACPLRNHTLPRDSDAPRRPPTHGRAESSKLCKAIARRPACRSRFTRTCSAIRCSPT